MNEPSTLMINDHNANTPIPEDIVRLWYDVTDKPLPPLLPNLKYLTIVTNYNYPLQLPQSLVKLNIYGLYNYPIPSLQNLKYLGITSSMQNNKMTRPSIRFNKASLPNLRMLLVLSTQEHPIDAYLPNLEWIHIIASGSYEINDHLLHNNYVYYLLYYHVSGGNSKPWHEQYFVNIIRRTEINRYNKTKRQTSLFDDLL